MGGVGGGRAAQVWALDQHGQTKYNFPPAPPPLDIHAKTSYSIDSVLNEEVGSVPDEVVLPRQAVVVEQVKLLLLEQEAILAMLVLLFRNTVTHLHN
jgi:hypothetical protein